MIASKQEPVVSLAFDHYFLPYITNGLNYDVIGKVKRFERNIGQCAFK